jgi:hypothetical protein
VAIGTATTGSASYAIGATTRYHRQLPGAVPGRGARGRPGVDRDDADVPLVPYLVNVADRINQLDLKASRTFRMRNGRMTVSPSLELFNLINPDQIVSFVSTSYATSSYLRPNSIVQGRIIGLSVQTRW